MQGSGGGGRRNKVGIKRDESILLQCTGGRAWRGKLISVDSTHTIKHNLHDGKSQDSYVSNTYLLIPWCRVLLEKLTGLQLV